MTYSYIIGVPLILVYAVGFAAIKYYHGYTPFPGIGIIPTPYQLWGATAKSFIFPLYLLFSIGWSLEMVTHLEELCFWLFLVNAGSAQQDWFRSMYFKTWCLGSVLAVCYMPLVTIFTRSDPLKCEAYTFLAGSLGSLSLTLWFTPILWTFPSFLSNLRREGVDTATVVRLTKFHELNTIRIIFRFLFVCPLLVLGIDGVRPHVHINESMLWTDLLAMVAAFGCVVSSGITLVIFFPRSIEGEIAARDALKESRRRPTPSLNHPKASMSMIDTGMSTSQHADGGAYLLTSSPSHKYAGDLNMDDELMTPGQAKGWMYDREERSPAALSPPTLTAMPSRPSRRRSDPDMGMSPATLSEHNVSKHNLRMSNVNPLVHNFTSPIDMVYGAPARGGQPHPYSFAAQV